MNKDKKLHL